MTTIVNNPAPVKDSGGGMGMIIGFIVLIMLVYVFYVFGLPAIRGMQFGTPQINIPNKIDINIQQE